MPSVDDISGRILVDEKATVAFGGELHDAIRRLFGDSAVIYLHGNLGAGKTTLVRGILRLMKHSGAVKSPTYTLLEPYNIGRLDVYHFDLYRVNDPQELEFVGIDEIVDGPGLKLFEWPERAGSWLPAPQAVVTLTVVHETEPASREVTVEFR